MITQRVVINWVLVYLLLFLSGTWRFNLSANKYLVLGFLVALTAWFLFTDRKISDRFLFYAIVFTGFLFSLSLYTGGGITLLSVISALMKLLIAYFILKTVGSSFTETYIKLVVFLAVVSLFGYTTDKFYLFEGLVRKLPPVDEYGFEGIFYLYRFPWHIERNNSIFFEPGAYQVFLNAALFMLFFAKTSFGSRTIWVYITILVATLVTAFSTTGFLIFAVMFFLFLLKSQVASFTGKIVIIGIFFVVVGAFSTQFYSTFIVKLNDYLTAGEYDTGGSARARSNDSMTDLKIFRKHIFGVGYDNYVKEFSSVGRVFVEEGSSNGVTRTLAVMGLPFSLFLFGSFYWAIKKLLGDFMLASAAFGMVILFLAGESYYVITPVSMAIIAAAFVFDRRSEKREPQRDTRELPNQAEWP